MDGTPSFITVIAIIFGILQIILFFKLWGATNDIREIKNKYFAIISSTNSVSKTSANKISNENNNKNTIPETSKFKIGEVVINKKTNKKTTITGYDPNSGKFRCYNENTFSSETWDLDENEMEPVKKSI